MLTSAPVRIGRGIWRSLVARLFWVQEAHSSNLCIPTILLNIVLSVHYTNIDKHIIIC